MISPYSKLFKESKTIIINENKKIFTISNLFPIINVLIKGEDFVLFDISIHFYLISFRKDEG